MGEDSRVPPLSRRVPGATNRPKPQLRTAPPVLPDDVIERLRARAKIRSEVPAEQVPPEPAEQAAPLPPLPQRVRKTDDPPHQAKATGQVRPDTSGSQGLDSTESTEPIPVIPGAADSAVQPPASNVTSATPARPTIAARPKEARVRVLAKVALPSRPATQPGPLPGRVPDGAETPKDSAQDTRTMRPAGSAWSPEADSADITEPIPVISGVAKRPAQDQALDAPAAQPTPPAQPAPADQAPTRRWRLSAQPVHAEVPEPHPAESELAPIPGAPAPGQTMLRPLFAESDTLEEVVATVRAQAADRESHTARRLWRRIKDNL
jgi:hypothetical protein